jgi:hypothetical protein
MARECDRFYSDIYLPGAFSCPTVRDPDDRDLQYELDRDAERVGER